MSTARLHLKIGGMACSFCTETIRKAFSRTDGVQAVHVSLAHEEALVEYDPALADPTALEDTLRALGYTVRPPRRVRSSCPTSVLARGTPYKTGRVKMKVEPTPTQLSTQMRPPWASTICLAMARPSPDRPCPGNLWPCKALCR